MKYILSDYIQNYKVQNFTLLVSVLFHLQLTSILSILSSAPCKESTFFFLFLPKWRNSLFEIPKMLSESASLSTNSPFLDLSSDVYLIHENPSKEIEVPSFTLVEIFQIKSQTPFIFKNVSRNGSISIIFDLFRKSYRRSDFQNVEIRGVCVVS